MFWRLVHPGLDLRYVVTHFELNEAYFLYLWPCGDKLSLQPARWSVGNMGFPTWSSCPQILGSDQPYSNPEFAEPTDINIG